MENKLETQLEKMVENYPENIKRTIFQEFNKLEKGCLDLVKKILPQQTIPIYMSMINSELITDREKVTTWNDYQQVGEFSEFDDQYCRPVKMADGIAKLGKAKGNYMYPERQVDGQIILKDCNFLFDENMKDVADISSFIPAFIDLTKKEMLDMERSNVSDINSITKLVDNKISEFEYLEKQKIQNQNLIENHHYIINERRDTIQEKENTLNDNTNNYNIKKDTLSDFLLIEENKIKRNNLFRTIIKFFVFLLWCIVVGLLLFHNIGYVKM